MRAVAERRGAVRRGTVRGLVVVVAAVIGVFASATPVATTPAPAIARAAPRWPAFTAAGCGIPVAFAGAFRSASRATHLSLALLAAVAWEESRMHADARSPVGAQGLLQLMPGTARLVGVNRAGVGANVLAGARYLRRLVDRFGGDVELALSAYNVGPTALESSRVVAPIGTLRYAKNIEARAASLTRCV